MKLTPRFQQSPFLIVMMATLSVGISFSCGASSLEEEERGRTSRQGIQTEQLPFKAADDEEEAQLVRALALSLITPEQEEQTLLAEVARFQERSARQDLILSQDQAYYGGLYQDEAKELIPHLTAQISLLEEALGQLEEQHTHLIHDLRRADQSERLQRQLPDLQKKAQELADTRATESIKLELLKAQLAELSHVKATANFLEPSSS